MVTWTARRIRHILLLVAAIVSFGANGTGASAERATVVASSPADVAIADWALARYAAAGLELPPVTIVFHDDPASCADNSGLYRSFRIDACLGGQTLAYARRTLVHELAHAWSEAHLLPEDQARFLELRGLRTWNSKAVPWVERGFEQAAEVLTWGVGERTTRILLPDRDRPDELAVAFETLTGRQALPEV